MMMMMTTMTTTTMMLMINFRGDVKLAKTWKIYIFAFFFDVYAHKFYLHKITIRIHISCIECLMGL